MNVEIGTEAEQFFFYEYIRCSVKLVYGEGPTRAATEEQKCLVPPRQALRTNQWRTPFICTLWVPIHHSFNSRQRPPISSLSGAAFNPSIAVIPGVSHVTWLSGGGVFTLFCYGIWYLSLLKYESAILDLSVIKVICDLERGERARSHMTRTKVTCSFIVIVILFL